MNAAGLRHRGEASGVRSLTTNTGMLISIAFSLVLVTSSIPRDTMLAIFAGTVQGIHGAKQAASLQGFIQGLHVAFWTMSGISLMAAVLSALRGSSPVEDAGSVTPVLETEPTGSQASEPVNWQEVRRDKSSRETGTEK